LRLTRRGQAPAQVCHDWTQDSCVQHEAHDAHCTACVYCLGVSRRRAQPHAVHLSPPPLNVPTLGPSTRQPGVVSLPPRCTHLGLHTPWQACASLENSQKGRQPACLLPGRHSPAPHSTPAPSPPTAASQQKLQLHAATAPLLELSLTDTSHTHCCQGSKHGATVPARGQAVKGRLLGQRQFGHDKNACADCTGHTSCHQGTAFCDGGAENCVRCPGHHGAGHAPQLARKTSRYATTPTLRGCCPC
jgi:hypothetical protein